MSSLEFLAYLVFRIFPIPVAGIEISSRQQVGRTEVSSHSNQERIPGVEPRQFPQIPDPLDGYPTSDSTSNAQVLAKIL